MGVGLGVGVGVRGGSRQCNQMTQGGGECFQKMSRDIFWAKKDFLTFKANFRSKMSKIKSASVSPKDKGGGSKIGKKSVTYYLNRPLQLLGS